MCRSKVVPKTLVKSVAKISQDIPKMSKVRQRFAHRQRELSKHCRVISIISGITAHVGQYSSKSRGKAHNQIRDLQKLQKELSNPCVIAVSASNFEGQMH